MTNLDFSTKKCLICRKSNDTLHWHKDAEKNTIWVYCVGSCQRGYSLDEYIKRSNISKEQFLKQDFDLIEAKPNEVNKLAWPESFVSLLDPRAEEGLEYVKSRGLTLGEEMFYDTWRKGVVFPYNFDSMFCGAQVRLITPWTDEDGDVRKVDTMPGTRLGLLFYRWNQTVFMPNVKAIIVTEGAFNAIAIQQSLDAYYGGPTYNPWKAIATSGSGLSNHQTDVLKKLKDQGYKVIVAPDSDKAGLKMLKKAQEKECATHYVLTMDDQKDWNDLYREMGHSTFNKFLLKGLKPCQVIASNNL